RRRRVGRAPERRRTGRQPGLSSPKLGSLSVLVTSDGHIRGESSPEREGGYRRFFLAAAFFFAGTAFFLATAFLGAAFFFAGAAFFLAGAFFADAFFLAGAFFAAALRL